MDQTIEETTSETEGTAQQIENQSTEIEEENLAPQDQTNADNEEDQTQITPQTKKANSSTPGSRVMSGKLSARSNHSTAEKGANDQAVKQDVRSYLEEKVFPILTTGLEELLKAVDDREKKLQEEDENIPEIRPLLFLARYLMRNAPQHSESTSKSVSRHSSHSNLDDPIPPEPSDE